MHHANGSVLDAVMLTEGFAVVDSRKGLRVWRRR
jgi:hypothetical protein